MKSEARTNLLWTIDILRLITDFTIYWSQLVVTLAVALERYILIVYGTKSKAILRTQRRKTFYSIVIFIVVILPVLVIADFCKNYEPSFHDAKPFHAAYFDYNPSSVNETRLVFVSSKVIINDSPEYPRLTLRRIKI